MTLRPFVLLAALLASLCLGRLRAADPMPAPSGSAFGALIEKLSEPGGDFGGDNLISNEQSYLRVMPELAQRGVAGGAYVGVGPDQNFSYIAQVKPDIAYLIDIRRDNLLLLLLHKALFAETTTRIGYLCLLTGRAGPAGDEMWGDAPIDRIIEHIDQAAVLGAAEQQSGLERLMRRIETFGFPLTDADRRTIEACRKPFVAEGLSLVFQARGQPRRSYYPTLRTLLRETDGEGHQLSYLAEEARFQFVRRMQEQNRIVPVIGDVSGTKAMRAIAADMQSRNLKLSCFYISNVEYYLFRGPAFGRYTENLKTFPHDARSTVIRSVFPSGGSRSLPQFVPGLYSASVVQSFETMLDDIAKGRYSKYSDLLLSAKTR